MANFFDYTYDDIKNPSKIIIWEQNYNTNQIETKYYDIDDYLYFYVESNKTNSNILSQYNKPVKKVWASSYDSYKKGEDKAYYIEEGFRVFESDIEPSQKVIFDNYGKDNMKSPNWNFALFDIETDIKSDQTFEEMVKKSDAEINAISVWYSYSNKFYELVLVPPSLRNLYNYNNIEKRDHCEIIYFNSEKKLLETFYTLNKENQTIAIGAWNGDYFDINYVYNRTVFNFGKKKTAELMGRFHRINKIKQDDEILYNPIGFIWYDCLKAYKLFSSELESFKLSFVAETEGVPSKIEFEGNFELLYHGNKQLRNDFDMLAPSKLRKKLVQKAIKKYEKIYEKYFNEAYEKIKENNEFTNGEKITRSDTEAIKEMENSTENKDDLFKIFIIFKKLKNTFDLFIDYSIQDTKILYDLETKLKIFNKLMMLAQYNASKFRDVFTTISQVENGITNYAHNYLKKVVIDRDIDISKQTYNKFVDKDLLDLKINKNYKFDINDSEKIKEYKRLLTKDKIPGANVLLPNIGLISFKANEKRIKLINEYNELLNEYNSILQKINN